MRSEEALNDAARLSVIVASYNSPATLEKCLESLTGQLDSGAEVIVADASTEDPRPRLGSRFAGVQFLRFPGQLTIPELRREALKIAKGEIILLTEGRIVPSYGWAAALVEAHHTHPQAPAVGGPIDPTPTSPLDFAIYLCEYGRHMPPTGDGECEELSGANLSYKRWVLDSCRDLIDAAAWEPFLHRRLERQGYRLWRAGQALACYHNSLSIGQVLRQRFHYGRWFAASRVEKAGLPRRLFYFALSPLLPSVLIWRLGRIVFERRRFRMLFVRALPWTAMFVSAWALGEFCGYLAGKGTSDRKVF